MKGDETSLYYLLPSSPLGPLKPSRLGRCVWTDHMIAVLFPMLGLLHISYLVCTARRLCRTLPQTSASESTQTPANTQTHKHTLHLPALTRGCIESPPSYRRKNDLPRTSWHNLDGGRPWIEETSGLTARDGFIDRVGCVGGVGGVGCVTRRSGSWYDA